ncbi:hypothetical protein DSUL_30139 [Desulfovibrionales bacterium]
MVTSARCNSLFNDEYWLFKAKLTLYTIIVSSLLTAEIYIVAKDISQPLLVV